MRQVVVESEQDATRERLIEAALRCFASFGIDKTSMQDVATRAELSRKTLYRQFGDRNALIEAAVDAKAAEFAADAAAMLDRAASLSDAVVDYLVESVDRAARDPLVPLLFSPGLFDSTRSAFHGSSAARDVMRRCWAGILGRRARLDEVGTPSLDEVVDWIATLQFTFVGQALAGGRRGEELSTHLHTFVGPAFAALDHPVP